MPRGHYGNRKATELHRRGVSQGCFHVPVTAVSGPGGIRAGVFTCLQNKAMQWTWAMWWHVAQLTLLCQKSVENKGGFFLRYITDRWHFIQLGHNNLPCNHSTHIPGDPRIFPSRHALMVTWPLGIQRVWPTKTPCPKPLLSRLFVASAGPDCKGCVSLQKPYLILGNPARHLR